MVINSLYDATLRQRLSPNREVSNHSGEMLVARIAKMNKVKIIIIIIMFPKGYACFLSLDPQNEVTPSISSSVVLCSFVLLVYIVVPVLVFCLYPSTVGVVATFPCSVLFPLLCAGLSFFA